jgi:hypothetical protein
MILSEDEYYITVYEYGSLVTKSGLLTAMELNGETLDEFRNHYCNGQEYGGLPPTVFQNLVGQLMIP